MVIFKLLLLGACCTEVAFAHGGLKIMGDSEIVKALMPRSRHLFEAPKREVLREDEGLPGPLSERAVNMRCGAVNGSCPAGFCCSIGGFCGKDFHYCSGPACQLSYGDFCDGNRSPLGTSTRDVPRPLIGNLSYGGKGVYFCTKKNVVALTFDDGPYIYTSDVLDVLDKYNAKATFFITGNNMGKGAMDNVSTGYPQLLQRMHNRGHQIASHTWTHQNLSDMTPEHRENQMIYNEMAFRNVLGFFPTYMRPPYSEANNATEELMKVLGYHIIYYNINSDDYNNDSPLKIQNSKNNIDEQFATVNVSAGYPANFIEIAHDIHEQTAHNLTEWTLQRMKELGYGTSVTLGECLGDPKENWYRQADGASVDSPVSHSLPVVSPTPIPLSGPSSKATVKKSAATGRMGMNSILVGLAAANGVAQLDW